MSTETTSTDGAPAEVATSLHRGTNWWGAFVIGLAGTILVTGIVPFAVQSMGAAAIPAIALVVVIGLVVCLAMGELAALLPHRTGGMPSYAYESFKPLGETTARHVGGVSGWGYWLGWFPVAPINMILAAGYIAVLFHVPLGPSYLARSGRLGTPVTHRRAGHHHGRACWCCSSPATWASAWAPPSPPSSAWCPWSRLTLLVLLPVFKPSSFHWSNISGFHFADPETAGTVFFLAGSS